MALKDVFISETQSGILVKEPTWVYDIIVSSRVEYIK
jgi:hypothetical protein